MLAQMFNMKSWVKATDVDFLCCRLSEMLAKSEFTVLENARHNFKPFGFTALWLLSESHLALHTFPESGFSYIELSSCIKQPFDSFANLLKDCDLGVLNMQINTKSTPEQPD